MFFALRFCLRGGFDHPDTPNDLLEKSGRFHLRCIGLFPSHQRPLPGLQPRNAIVAMHSAVTGRDTLSWASMGLEGVLADVITSLLHLDDNSGQQICLDLGVHTLATCLWIF